MKLAVLRKVQNRKRIRTSMLNSTFTRPSAPAVFVSRPKLAEIPAPAIVNPKARTETSAETERLNR